MFISCGSEDSVHVAYEVKVGLEHLSPSWLLHDCILFPKWTAANPLPNSYEMGTSNYHRVGRVLTETHLRHHSTKK